MSNLVKASLAAELEGGSAVTPVSATIDLPDPTERLAYFASGSAITAPPIHCR